MATKLLMRTIGNAIFIDSTCTMLCKHMMEVDKAGTRDVYWLRENSMVTFEGTKEECVQKAIDIHMKRVELSQSITV